MLPTLVLVVSLSGCTHEAATADTGSTSHGPTTPSFWLIGGAVGWLQVGGGVGLLAASALPHERIDATFAIGAGIGVLAGTSIGLLLGWAASKDWLPAQLAVLAPLVVDLIVGAVLLGIGGHGGGCAW
jgi:hypothetical protein